MSVLASAITTTIGHFKEEHEMNKIPRFMREYANYIEREYLDGFSADIEDLLCKYERGLITVYDVMAMLVKVEDGWRR